MMDQVFGETGDMAALSRRLATDAALNLLVFAIIAPVFISRGMGLCSLRSEATGP